MFMRHSGIKDKSKYGNNFAAIFSHYNGVEEVMICCIAFYDGSYSPINQGIVDAICLHVCHVSCVMCCVLCVMCHMSCVVCCVSCVMCHVSCVMCCVLCVMCHVLFVICHVSPLICHISCFMCDYHVSWFIFDVSYVMIVIPTDEELIIEMNMKAGPWF